MTSLALPMFYVPLIELAQSHGEYTCFYLLTCLCGLRGGSVVAVVSMVTTSNSETRQL